MDSGASFTSRPSHSASAASSSRASARPRFCSGACSQRCANEGRVVTRKRCADPLAAAAAACTPSSSWARAGSTLRSSASPAAFSTTRRPRRSNSAKPSCSSSPRICWLTALCVRCRTSAAARKFCSSATLRNAVRVLRGKRAILVSIPDQYGQNKSFPVGHLALYPYQRRQPIWNPIMNSQPLQPSILLSRSLTERVVSGVGKALRAAGILRVHWRDSRARRREARAVDAIADMNAHMLRDIGAHDRLIAHAAARSDDYHRRRIAIQLSTRLLAVTLIATATLVALAEAADSRPTGSAPATAQPIGDFTGA